MPPPAHDAESRARYFTRLLAALALQAGGELVIDNRFLRQIDDDNSRQALIEETDCARDCLVLRYGSKRSAMYPVEPLSTTQTSSSPQSQNHPIPSSVTSPLAPPRKPMSISDLARAEQKLRQARVAAQMRAEEAAKRSRQPDEWLENLTRQERPEEP